MGYVAVRATPVVRGLVVRPRTEGTTMVATAPPEGLLASETEPPWALAASGGSVEAEPVVATSVARGGRSRL